MNTLEFRAAIQPQLHAQIRRWLWWELPVSRQKQLFVGFKNHLRSACCVSEDVPATLRNRIEELPLSISVRADPDYLETVTRHLGEVFYLTLDRFVVQDKAVNTILRIRAYEYRLKNFLDYLTFILESEKVRRLVDEPRQGSRHHEDTEWGSIHYL